MNLLNYRSDIYCTEDRLGFDKYIDVLSSIIRDQDFKTPFCIGIFGKWGSGKTSFMHLLQSRISQDQAVPYVIPVWFNPWRYEKEKHLIIPFLKTIEREIGKYIEDQKGLGKKLTEKLKGAATKIGDAACAFAYGMQADCKLGLAKITFDAAKMTVREEELARQRIEEAQKLSETLASTYYDIVTELKNAADKDFRIMVFIDDLDRCLPEKAVELLESIKLFLDLEGYLFVIGVDKEVVKKGISYRYRFFEHEVDKHSTHPTISPEDYLIKGEQFPEDQWLIERFIYLTEAALIKAKAPDVTAGYRLDYRPWDMVRIAKGTFLYGEEKQEKKIDHDYFIDRFPVTNRQYKEFLDDEIDHEVPYREGGAGFHNWDRENRTFPKGMEDHPVVLVSYYDAVKFCEWRSGKDSHEYRLPTEEEWERAGRGSDGRIYPWGDEFDEKKCNTRESGIDMTTPVTTYHDGASPHGCFDMAGNVWEWTEGGKVPRGGSWGDDRDSARCADRNRAAPEFRSFPVDRFIDIGFRCART
ncbi:MAG: SUMF1/EgtB/PvdO family nonheme iron enzyme [Deltaproteobacteria bacterium]|nr:SUMF1/EgtB/PvdO family nonheme iron enzyme [Deltaproteobacteria bacterium]